MKFIQRIILITIFFPLITTAQTSLHFTSTPAISPDGSEIIFSYNRNLWRASINGGLSYQITSLQGNTDRPRISPDGKWIAFSNSQFGNSDIYVMPAKGGDIRRLTFHQGSDLVESWSWDNQWIYFSSNRYDRMSTYKVNISGGTPIRVFSNNYFDYTHNAFENPVTGEIFFDDTWESFNFYNRIGYRGAFNPDVQSYNPKTGKYKRYTTWRGKDMSVSVDKNGKIYFISDEGNGQYNLCTFEGEKKKQLTNFNSSVMHPIVNANGNYIVFEKDFQLYRYDIASGKSDLIPLLAYKSNTLESEKPFDIARNVSAFNVSPDGKKMAFVSRGRLFVSDVAGKYIREINTLAEERVTEVYWLKDNETLLYTRTNKGFNNLFTINAAGQSPEKQITNEARNDRSLSFDKSLSKAVYLSGNNQVCLLNLKTMEPSVLATDEIWGLNSSTPLFSPDGEYVSYNGIRNFESDVILIRLKDKKLINITNTGVSEQDPIWSPDGKYIYFVSDRTHPSYPYGMTDAKVYRMALEKTSDPFKSDFFDSLFIEKKKDTSSKNLKTSDKPDSLQKMTIDFANIMTRLEQIGPSFGSQRLVDVTKAGIKTSVLFLSNHENGRLALWQWSEEPFEQPKTEKIKGVDGFVNSVSHQKGNYFVLSGGDIYKLNLNSNSGDKVDLKYSFQRNLKDEFNQMFYEAWAVLDENYYDVNFNNVNWKGIRDRYSKYLPFVETREDMRQLLNNMMGELNSSHYGFSSSGAEEATYYKTVTASTGVMFKNDAPFTVDYIIPFDVADLPENKIQSGDILTSVNGQTVDTKQSRESYFSQTTMPEEMTLTFKRGASEYSVKIHPGSYSASASKLYDLWEANNRNTVNILGKQRIGYVYMRDMSGNSLEKFEQDMVSDSVANKDALILDLRYNTGGNVHDEVLQFLSRKPYLQWKYRNGKISPQPNFAPAAKPIILLINEQTLSDGEMTSAGFKELKLGKIVGTETYRWIIFTSSARLVDGSSVRLPSWGCYTLDGKDLEKNGVSPDIFVQNTFTDRMESKDPQLDRAVQEILKELK